MKDFTLNEERVNWQREEIQHGFKLDEKNEDSLSAKGAVPLHAWMTIEKIIVCLPSVLQPSGMVSHVGHQHHETCKVLAN